MTVLTHVANETELPESTLVELFLEGVDRFGKLAAFQRMVAADRAVDIRFDETGPDRVQSVFRSVELELPDLEPGEYTLHLRLELFGRTPVVTSRPIIVEG